MESEEKDDTVISVTEKNSPELAEKVDDANEACAVPDAEGNVQIILEKVTDDAIEESKEESLVEEKVDEVVGEDGDSNSPKESSDLGKILEQRLDDAVRRSSCEEKAGEDKTESKDVAGDEGVKRKTEEADKHSSSSDHHKKERSEKVKRKELLATVKSFVQRRFKCNQFYWIKLQSQASSGPCSTVSTGSSGSLSEIGRAHV